MLLKVCGMRDTENLKELISLEPDFIGFIFYNKSKRFVAEFPIIDIPLYIKKVGVFVNEPIENLLATAQKYKLDYVQLHGDESVNYIKTLHRIQFEDTSESFQLGIIKAFSIDEHFDFSTLKAYEAVCDYFLFDTKGKEYGGNGVKFDWKILDNYKGQKPFFLSGGISKSDIESVNSITHKLCVGVDVNSGFETTYALKNIHELKEFKNKLQ
jgi:phosphoribosylanthranilate isomerase